MGASKGIRNFDCVGKTYGVLTVIELQIKEGSTQAVCLCECGKTRFCQPYYLKTRPSKKCACHLSKIASNNGRIKYSHGMSNSRVYRIWENMKQRCLNKKFKWYDCYGGRGISICEEWLIFDNFYRWAFDSGYDHKLTLDRRDNEGNYTPENCRWITNFEQQSNTRKTVRLTYKGETHHVSEWARRMGCTRGKILYRLGLGRPINVILSELSTVNN